MKQDERRPFDRALRTARLSAYPSGEFVGQESLMTGSEILALAARAGIVRGARVLDLCCGVAGPGRLIIRELGCRYLGVDASADAIAIARERADGLECRFDASRVPPLPAGPFDVVLLLETMLAFSDKQTLLARVAAALAPGGRFAFTLEEGEPLTAAERRRVPDADTVWLAPLAHVRAWLEEAGLALVHVGEWTESHRAVAGAMVTALEADRPAITAGLGEPTLEDLLAAHRFWEESLRSGRVRKLALVAER